MFAIVNFRGEQYRIDSDMKQLRVAYIADAEPGTADVASIGIGLEPPVAAKTDHELHALSRRQHQGGAWRHAAMIREPARIRDPPRIVANQRVVDLVVDPLLEPQLGLGGD